MIINSNSDYQGTKPSTVPEPRADGGHNTLSLARHWSVFQGEGGGETSLGVMFDDSIGFLGQEAASV